MKKEHIVNSKLIRVIVKLLFDEYTIIWKKMRSMLENCTTQVHFHALLNQYMKDQEIKTLKGLLIAPKIFSDMGYTPENLRFRSIQDIMAKPGGLETFIRDEIPKDNATLIGLEDIAFGFTLDTRSEAVSVLREKEQNLRLTIKDIILKYAYGISDIRKQTGQRSRTAWTADVLRKNLETLRQLYTTMKDKYNRIRTALHPLGQDLVQDLDDLYMHVEFVHKLKSVMEIGEEEFKLKTLYPPNHFYHGEIICKTQTPYDSLTAPVMILHPDDPIGVSAEVNFFPSYACQEAIKHAGGKKETILTSKKETNEVYIPEKKYLFHTGKGYSSTVCLLRFYRYDAEDGKSIIDTELLLEPSEFDIQPYVEYTGLEKLLFKLKSTIKIISKHYPRSQ